MTPKPSLQVTRAGLTQDLSAAQLRALGAQFKKRHAVSLPGFLEPSLVERLNERMKVCGFQEFRNLHVDGRWIDQRQTPVDKTLNGFLVMLLENPELLKVVRAVVGCKPIKRLTGCIFRTPAGTDHHLDWHRDFEPGRVAALTINLSPAPFKGGSLQFRYRDKPDEVIDELRYPEAGDACLFRIGEDLQHRSTPVEGKNPKVIFSCWFHLNPLPAETGDAVYASATARA